MSRSKRAPFCTDGYGTKIRKYRKRSANKAVRQTPIVSSGAEFKRVYNSWAICDFKFWDSSKKASRK